MAMLICEGACNPTRYLFDAAAEDYAEKLGRPYYGKDSDVVHDAQALCARLRQSLTHTAHVQRSEIVWACLTCGAERHYGGHRRSIDLGGHAA